MAEALGFSKKYQHGPPFRVKSQIILLGHGHVRETSVFRQLSFER